MRDQDRYEAEYELEPITLAEMQCNSARYLDWMNIQYLNSTPPTVLEFGDTFEITPWVSQ